MNCSICNQQTNNVTINGSLTLCPACVTRLALAAPALLRGCEQAADLLGRLNTPDAPTWVEVAELRGRLLATVAMARGTAVERGAEPAEGFTFWREMGDPEGWHTWPVSGIEEP